MLPYLPCIALVMRSHSKHKESHRKVKMIIREVEKNGLGESTVQVVDKEQDENQNEIGTVVLKYC